MMAEVADPVHGLRTDLQSANRVGMITDLLGNPVTGADAPALAAIDDFVGGMLAYQTRAVRVLDVAADATEAPLVQVYAGYLHLLAEATGAEENARPYLAAAARALTHATPRERLLADALRHWIADEIDEVVEVFEAVLTAHPRDLATLKLLHYHQFNRGAFPAMLRAAERSVEAGPDLPYVHGMAAFGYEQLHLMRDAEQAARRALAIVPDDPWAQHALAHVMLTQGRIDEGVAFLEAAAPGWHDLNSFMVTHLWWHLALFYLSQGREGDALGAYDAQVWAVAKDYSQDQIGAVSLLARLEMAGIDVGDRWAELATYLAVRAGDVVQPFLSVQYLYGLVRAGRPEAGMLLAAIERRAARGGPWQEAALPLAHGLVAHAEGRHDAAVVALSDALPRLIRLGGSHAQRDLFDQLLLDAEVRSGRLVEAQQRLELRRAHDPDGVTLNRLLARVYGELGLPRQAAEAEARVARRLAG